MINKINLTIGKFPNVLNVLKKHHSQIWYTLHKKSKLMLLFPFFFSNPENCWVTTTDVSGCFDFRTAGPATHGRHDLGP